MKNYPSKTSKQVGFALIGLLFAASSLLLLSPATVKATTEGDYNYTVLQGTATITGYVGSGGDVTIPSTLGGCPVDTIRDRAFYGCTSLTSVTIPSSVTSIGNNAFCHCTSLASITIPNGVTSIGDYAFYYCTSLTSATVSSSMTNIGNYAFYYCSSLTSITFLAQSPPAVGLCWINNTNAGLLGHAYNGSSFPTPGNSFNGLTMGAYISAVSVSRAHAPPSSALTPTGLPVAARNELPAWASGLLIAVVVIAALLAALLFRWRRGKNKIVATADDNGTTAHAQ